MEMDVARRVSRDALRNLESHRARINRLNVYPVPDGDTGTNMTLTVQFIVDELERSQATGHAAVAKELENAALRGALGNSGVILSQVVRGLAGVLGKQAGVEAATIRDALRAASDEAMSAIDHPVHGTMLTVMEAMAAAAELPEAGELDKSQLLAFVVERGEVAVAETQNQLPKLRDAGVVDAGGVGLVEILRGIYFSVAGIPVPGSAPVDEDGFPEIEHEFSTFQFCTNFVVEGSTLDREALLGELGSIGDSLHVVGSPSLLRVHVHTDDAERAIECARSRGIVSSVAVADMDEQIRERLTDLQTAVVAVVPGAGNRRLFGRRFGEVIVIEGGLTGSPSVQEIVAAIERARAPEVVILPNHPTAVAVALQSTEFTSRKVRVVETASLQAGLVAVNQGYFHGDRAEENMVAMADALDGLRTGDVATAVETTIIDGVEVRAGEWLGRADGRVLVCDSDFDEVVLAVARDVLADGADTFTAITGVDRPRLDEFCSRFAHAFPRVELEVLDGGQPHYTLLVFA